MRVGAQPQFMGGPHVGGAQTGGAHIGGGQGRGPQNGLGGGGAKMADITAAGMPIHAPQMLVQAPRIPPHNPKGEGGPQVGGAQDGGAQGAGKHE